MENIQILIWNELSRFVETEEEVFIHRRNFELRNCITSRSDRYPLSTVFSGSVAEGLNLLGSDIDVMFVFDDISVSDSYDDPVSSCDMIMDTTYIKPGFVRLLCHDNIRYPYIISSAVAETDNGLLLSSLLFRDAVVKEHQMFFPTSVGHGPCSTFKLPLNVDSDVLVCFSCKTWPIVANEWVIRNRNNNWPPRDLISNIVRGGCLVVPIGNPHSQENHMQWRISFSIAEKKLFHSMNHTQSLCYGLLKLYLKHVINSNIEVNDLMCSYFLKTCLFYCIEEEHISWIKETFLDCFWTCFRRLIKWIKDEYCPNYFIKENNMFEGKICGEKGRKFHSYMNELYHEGLHSLWRIPCLSELQIFTTSRPVLTSNAISNAEREYFCDKALSTPAKRTGMFSLISCIRRLAVIDEMKQDSTNNIDKVILTMTYYSTVHQLIQLLYQRLCTNESNKNIYRHMNEIKSLIVHNCLSFDKCTGMLLLVTLCYLMRRYKEANTIVKKVVAKLKCSVVYIGYTNGFNKEAYINELCGKGLTLYQKFNLDIFAFVYLCRIDCMFYLSEIEQELVQHSMMEKGFIHPMVYSYVLMFLSYLHMNSRQNMVDTLCELYSTVYDRSGVTELQAPLAISLLEKCIQLFESWCGNCTES